MNLVWGIIVGLLALMALVVAHEFGHFLAARLFGVGVVEFSVGFGPRLLSHVSKKSGTRYSLKLFPLGGSCAMMGELEDEETEAGEERLENTGAAGKDTAGELLGGSFLEQSPIARFCIIAAGPVFNFILAYVLAVVILSWAGYDAPVLVGTTEGQPAQEAGMAAGDVITAIEGRSIHFSRDIQLYNLTGDGSPM